MRIYNGVQEEDEFDLPEASPLTQKVSSPKSQIVSEQVEAERLEKEKKEKEELKE